MIDKDDDEERRLAFINDEANYRLMVDDVAEAIRDLLRALAAKDPSEPLARAVQTVRSITKIWGNDLPAERALAAVVSQLVNLDDARSQHGSIIDTTRPALRYFAEATATDNFSQARLGPARSRYEHDIKNIDAVNALRRGDET